MAQPQAYNRETDFTERDGDDTNHPGINIELDAAAQSINEIRNNLALIQRDDGALQNGIVTAESLAPSAFDAVLVEVNLAVTDAQTAATSANNAAVSANTARDQAVAAKDAAETANTSSALNAATANTKAAEANASATAAAASATSASTSASTATTKASEASTSAANAATSATASATSATNAANSATAAAGSATTATTQATSATNSATAAAGSASSAATSATAAAASFDQFDDRYLGSKTTDPTTDNDGNALLSGALYFNSVAGEMRVWADTFWKATGSSVGGTINTAKYTATAGQTTFAIVYDVGFVHVYLNGLKLESGVDFTANNGTSVVLATGATAGDVVDMIAFGIFSVANTYTKAEADTLLAGKLATTAGAVGTANLADGLLAATTQGLAKMADGFLQATTAGLAKMADGFLAATAAGRAKMADGFLTQSKLAAGVAGNGPAFSAYQSAAQVFAGGASTKVLFDVEQYDTNNCFASSRFTPTVAGYYLLTFSFYRPSTSGAGEVQVAISKNGQFYSGADQVASNTILLNMSVMLYMNGSTDYAEAFAYVATGGTTSPTGVYTLFQGAMIRSA